MVSKGKIKNNYIMNKIESALQRTTDTKDLVIGAGVLDQTPALFKKLFPGQKAVIVADTTTYAVAGEAVERYMREAGVELEQAHIFTDPHLYAEWSFIEELEAHLKEVDAIAVAVGSGVINDLTKLVSAHLGRKYMVVGTAASMDGYTAFGASITFEGNKQTFSCPAPYGMVLDSEISAAAPKHLAASGYADLIAKIPAGADWMIADVMGAEAMDDFSFGLVQDGLRDALSAPAAVFEGDVEMTQKLADGLIMSGFAMQALQSSRPASGIEHQFSHCWDMENLCYNGEHVSHGFKVGVGTLASTAILEYLLEQDLTNLDVEKCVSEWKSLEEIEADAKRIFAGNDGLTARALEETRNKYVDKEGLRAQLTAIKEAWPTLKEQIRAQIIPFDEVYANLKAVGAPYEPEMIGVSRERFRKTFTYMPYMRSRVTSIDVLFRCGMMDEVEEHLFGKGGHWEVENA